MNQILDYNPNKNSGGGSSGSDKIVRVFAVLLIIVAIALVGMGAYGMLKNTQKQSSVQAVQSKANISFDIQDTTIIINVSHDKNIEKLVYCWDNGKETTIKGKDSNTMQEEIPTNAGEHTLTVKVTDVDQVESMYEETITSENGNDLLFPTITLEPNGNKLKITASDDTGMSFVTYRWNTDDEVKVEETSEDGLSIEFEIDILVGKNDLVVVASDTSGNVSTESKSYTGILNPEIEMIVANDKKTVEVKATHDEGLKLVNIIINGVEYPQELADSPKETSFTIELADPTTTLVVKAESTIGTTKEVSEEIVQDPIEDEITISIEPTETANLMHVKVECAAGLKDIVLNVNGTDYGVQIEEGSTANEFDFQIVENSSTKVTATSVNGTVKEETKDLEFVQ